MMYQSINSHKRVYDIYSQKLITEGVITEELKKELWTSEINRINEAYTRSRSSDFDSAKWKKGFHYNNFNTDKRKDKFTSITK